jgi:hypothetical protein
MKGRLRSARQAGKRGLASLVVAGLAAGLALSATASARPQALMAPSECIGTVNGAPWHYKGRHGTAYTVLGVNGASCATGAKLVPGWTRGGGDLKRVPAGWHCSATLAGKLGECTTSKGGIFEWSPKHKT